jgi:hypothetical protein
VSPNKRFCRGATRGPYCTEAILRVCLQHHESMRNSRATLARLARGGPARLPEYGCRPFVTMCPWITTLPPNKFCTNRYCGERCCNRCRPFAADAVPGDGAPPMPNQTSSLTPRSHLLYIHMRKTGGSSIECATQSTLVPMGMWSNLGHLGSFWHKDRGNVRQCMERCTFLGMRPKVIITIREPYTFWRGRYTYHMESLRRRGMRTFAEFMGSPQRPGAWPDGQTPQSYDIHTACGNPCIYDYALHTEDARTGLVLASQGARATQNWPHASLNRGRRHRPACSRNPS